MLENLVLLAERVDTTDLNNTSRPCLYLTLGNIYQKMSCHSNPIHHLTRADDVLEPDKEHNWDAMILISEIIICNAVKMTMNSNEQREMIQNAVEVSRSLLGGMRVHEPEQAWGAERQLAGLLHNQCSFGPAERIGDKMREINELATRGYHKALEKGSKRRVETARQLLHYYTAKPQDS